jgi:hypothetical protein
MMIKFTCYQLGSDEVTIDVQMDAVPRQGDSIYLATTNRIWTVFHVRWMPGEAHAAEVAIR